MNSNHYCSNPAKMMIILVVLVSNALLAESTSDKNIMEVLDQNKARFSTLIGAIKMTGLEATLLGGRLYYYKIILKVNKHPMRFVYCHMEMALLRSLLQQTTPSASCRMMSATGLCILRLI